MKLIIDCRMINSSGIGTYIKNLLPFLENYFDLILLGNEKEIEKLNLSKVKDIIQLNSKIYSIKEQLELFNKTPKGDIFWSPHYNIPIFPIKVKKRVVTIHDVFHLAFYDTLNFKQKIYAKTMINLALKLSDIVFTVSNFSKSEITKHVKVREDKLKVVYNGVDQNIFKPIKDNDICKNIKNKYNLPDSFILYVGNVKPHKNLKNALLAFEKVSTKFCDFKFVIIGKKEGFITGDNEIMRIIASSKVLNQNVVFTGYIEDKDLPFIYNVATIFVFPSLYEGFGLPPLEAMACGCPCVVSNAASLPEVCGDAAYYVNPYDVEDIARGIERVLTDENLRQSLIQKGFENVKRFSWENSAKKMIEIIKGLK